MGIVGLSVVLVNTVIDFLIFWDDSIDTSVIPCSSVTIIFLIYIPTVINYNVHLCVFLWGV